MPTCTHLQVVPCQEKQIIRKFVRDVPCPRMKSKKKVPCPAGERRKVSKQVEDVLCSAAKRVEQEMTCSMKQPEKTVKCEREEKTCPGKQRETTPRGCPKCENTRIQKLECEVYQLRKEIEYMKYERKEAERAMQKAIIRSARALGGGCKSAMPGSIEKLLDSCTSDESSLSVSTITFCGTKPMSPPIRPCQNNNKKKKKEENSYECCASCAH